MAKKPGIPLLKNRIKRKEKTHKPLQAARLTKPVQVDALWDEDSPEEGLEDTPVVSSASAEPAAGVLSSEPVEAAEEQDARFIKAAEEDTAKAGENAQGRAGRQAAAAVVGAPHAAGERISKSVLPEPRQKRFHNSHRRNVVLPGVLHSVGSAVSRLFYTTRKKSSGNAAALEFAGSNKRIGRKGRRNRRILVYSGSALAVVAIMLLVFLVPGGASAPVDASATPVYATLSATGTSSAESAGVAGGSTGSGTATATVTQTATPTPIPTTPPDPSERPIDVDELTGYFVVNADKYYNDYGYSSNYYNYSEEELRILAQVIWGEARGEGLTGKIAVANVVMNRVLCRGAWPNTIKGVVTAAGQFSGYKPTNPTTGCISAARWVLDYQRWVIPQDIYYFKAGGSDGVDWGGHTFYKRIGGHCFYRESYSGRRQNAGVPDQLYERVYKYAQYGCEPGDRVYRIQVMLDELGYKIPQIDSYFGMDTKEALKKFQNDHGLDDDGIAGPSTVKRLIEEYGARDYYAKFCT